MVKLASLFAVFGLLQLGAGDDIVAGTYAYPIQGRILFPGTQMAPTTKVWHVSFFLLKEVICIL
jgi:hypothetical protein